MTAYQNWALLQKRIADRPKSLAQKVCQHPRTYLTNTKMRDYPNGEWVPLPVHRMCRDCWWPEPVE